MVGVKEIQYNHALFQTRNTPCKNYEIHNMIFWYSRKNMHSHARVVILIKRTHVKLNVHCICEFTGLFVFVLFVWIFFGMRIISVRNNVINLLNQELIGLLFSSHSFNMSNLITFYMKNISFEGCWILKMLSVTHLHSMSIFFFII